MVFKDLRSYINFLNEKNCLIKINKPVNPRFELAALTKKFDGKSAVLFEKVTNYKASVAVNLFTKREWFNWILNVKEHGTVLNTIINAAENPIPTKSVSDAPIKEVILTENIDLLKTIPIPTHYRLDGGPYITAGVIIAKDPETGARNASYARMQVTGKNKLSVMINNWRHLFMILQKMEEKNEPLEVAIVISAPPSVIIEGGMPGALVPLDVDELNVAGALMGKPLEVTKCETIDLEVPAFSEIVLEGEIPPHVREEEGPFADYAFVYDALVKRRLTPIINVKAILQRSTPIYYDILPAAMDHLLIGGIPREAEIFNVIRKTGINVRQVHLTEGSSCRFHAIIQIKKKSEVDGKNAILAAFYPTESARDLKLAIIVDDDIDPFNLKDVEWAIATRVQYNKNIMVITGSAGALDPSAIISTPEKILEPPRDLKILPTVMSSKLGIDATKTFVKPDLVKIYQKPDIPYEDSILDEEEKR
ncbi:MAG: UbiD family decarboxylase [Candidatus Odinarchaeia archaeon]